MRESKQPHSHKRMSPHSAARAAGTAPTQQSQTGAKGPGALVHPADERRGGEPPLSDALLRPLRRGVVHVVHRAVPRIPRARLVRVRFLRLPSRLVALFVEYVVRVEWACGRKEKGGARSVDVVRAHRARARGTYVRRRAARPPCASRAPSRWAAPASCNRLPPLTTPSCCPAEACCPAGL